MWIYLNIQNTINVNPVLAAVALKSTSYRVLRESKYENGHYVIINVNITYLYNIEYYIIN